MSHLRVVLACLLALPAIGLPASAAVDEAQAATPASCQGRTITLQEGERLEERTLYFHGIAPIGNIDGAQDANAGGAIRLTMDGTGPTTADSKRYFSRPTGVVGNPNSVRNHIQGYWFKQLTGPERIVCGAVKVFAATTTGTLTTQLWVDAPRGVGATVAGSVTGNAPANQISAFETNFGALDITAQDNLLIQLDSATPGALVHYDSTAHPSAFTYAVVVPPAAP